MRKKKIVVIGGGNGSAIVLVALKQYSDLFDLSAIISMSDSGGSSGKLRKDLGALPPGDIMRAVLALSKYDYPVLKKIFYANRFSVSGKLNKHNLGNIFLALSSKYNNSFLKSVRSLEESVESLGKVFPVTTKINHLVAELSNGKIVKTEASIDEPTYDRKLRLKKVWLEPKVKADKEAVNEVLSADYIVLCPGSLYTSVIATLLPMGIKEAINKSSAKLIFVAGNAFRSAGETGPIVLSETIGELENYLPRPLDLTLFNNHKLAKDEMDFYKSRKWGIINFDSEKLKEKNIISFDFSRTDGGLCSTKLGKKLKEIILSS